MAIAFNFAARSDVGMVRSNNEDSGYAGPHLLAMADGMGGHAGGDVASSTVIGSLVSLDGESFSGTDATEALLRRITDANHELGELAEGDSELDGMGTTLIAILRARDKLVLAHIGDSRAYLVRDGQAHQITKDHSFVQSLVDEGRLTSDEASTHPQRSLVTRVLTGVDGEEPDVVVRQAIEGDRYLICSDGLSDYVARDTIDEVLTTVKRPDDCAEKLVQLALRAGAPDNVTVVVGDVVDLVKGPVPSDQPQVVGAAAAMRAATRPIPVTPAEKAAALSQSASGSSPDDDEPADPEPGTSRSKKALRALAVAALTTIFVIGGGYAAWSWTQQQVYVGVNNERVAVFRGVNQEIGPVRFSQPETTSETRVDDLPEFYQNRVSRGISMQTDTAATALLRNLEVQAQACRYAQSQGRACATVPPTWTSPTPTGSPTVSPTSTPTGSASPSAGATPTTQPSGIRQSRSATPKPVLTSANPTAGPQR